jgi:hypothetical protein
MSSEFLVQRDNDFSYGIAVKSRPNDPSLLFCNLSSLILISFFFLFGCGSNQSITANPSRPAQPEPLVLVSPSTTTVASGHSVQFAVQVLNSSNQRVSWKATQGIISHSGLYTAPQVITAIQVTITATSASALNLIGSAIVTVAPPPSPSVRISPSAAVVPVGQSQQFTAFVQGIDNGAVNWCVAGIQGGNMIVGTISSSGFYTAPQTLPSNPTVQVTALSAADESHWASSSVVITSATTVGTTYYIDSLKGSDNNAGTSSAAPWKTLAKVASWSLSPGDQILLSRGSTWYEQLSVPASGSAGNPLVFATYGSGNAPAIDGGNTEKYGVVISGKSNVVVDGLAIQNLVAYGVVISNSPHVTVQNCALKNIGDAGILIGGGSPYASVDHCSHFNDPGYHSSQFVKLNNTSSDNPTISNNLVGDLGHGFAINLNDTNNANVLGNTVTGNGSGININAITRNVVGAQVHDNYLTACSSAEGDGECIELTGESSAATVTASLYRNFVEGGPRTVNGISAVYTTNSFIYDNVVMNGNNSGFHFTSQCTNDQFYNNVAYHWSNYGFLFGSGSLNNVVKNNIVQFTGTGIAASTESIPSEDYNIVDQVVAVRSKFIPAGTHTLNVDPMFISTSPTSLADFRLNVGSPAIDSGANLGSPYNLLFDPDGVGFPLSTADQNAFGTGWERGAFVYRP